MSLLSHLKSRHLNVALHCPVIDEDNGLATFYLWNLSGQLVGYQQYCPTGEKTKRNDPRDGKYFTFHSKEKLAVWGVESLHLSPNVLFVAEGVFDAARITNLGFSAIAVLGNDNSSDLGNWLSSLGRTIVVVPDNDNAGIKLAKFGDYFVYPDAHDLGDASDKFVIDLLKRFG
jgi:hypothetical protein